MEAAGLVVGIAGLAGLFSTCLQLFELFELGSNHGKDYETLLARLKAEKVRFLLWGENTGVWMLKEHQQQQGQHLIAENEIHGNLKRPIVLDAVRTIFSAMRAAFVDITTLIDRYTLDPTPIKANNNDDDSTVIVRGAGAGPTNIAATVVESVGGGYPDFLSRVKASQEGARFSRKLRWALRDKKMADDLIATIRGFNDSLVHIVPIVNGGSRRLPPVHYSRRFGDEDIRTSSGAAGLLGSNPSSETVPLVEVAGNESLLASSTDSVDTTLPERPGVERSPQSPPETQILAPGLPNAQVVTEEERQLQPHQQAEGSQQIHRKNYPPKCIKRITGELDSFSSLLNSPFSLSPMDDGNITICRASIEGPENTPYASGLFHLSVSYPPEYPFKPPTIRFLTRIYHINVNYNTGELCLEKNINGYWSPVMTTLELLRKIRALMVTPNLDEPFLLDVATLFKSDRSGYEKVARFYTETQAQAVKPAHS